MQKKQSSENSVQAFGKLFSDTNEKKNKLFCSRQSNSIYTVSTWCIFNQFRDKSPNTIYKVNTLKNTPPSIK